MYYAIVIVFVLGYAGIALEHKTRINKASVSLLLGGICWAMIMVSGRLIMNVEPGIDFTENVNMELADHLADISGILFFLLGAMTIVELIDAHDGFTVVTDLIVQKNKVKLLWITSVITFFLSAVLDNLTTAIIMAAVLRKLIPEKEDLLVFGGMVVLAANAGGAWSPIGDVTTIMLWVGGQITAGNIIIKLFLPSVICLVTPLIFLSLRMKGSLLSPREKADNQSSVLTTRTERVAMLISGIAALVFVLVFKIATHLPPYIGMIVSLGMLWFITELVQRRTHLDRQGVSMVGILKRLDLPTIFFFLGILLAVAALETSGHLHQLSKLLDRNFNSIYVINYIIGVLSAIVDNVPLVAGAAGMYPLENYGVNHDFWELLAYCAGTGGSILIIGSAAGVAIMGILKIDFLWYMKKISLLALIGYTSGLISYYLMQLAGL